MRTQAHKGCCRNKVLFMRQNKYLYESAHEFQIFRAEKRQTLSDEIKSWRILPQYMHGLFGDSRAGTRVGGYRPVCAPNVVAGLVYRVLPGENYAVKSGNTA